MVHAVPIPHTANSGQTIASVTALAVSPNPVVFGRRATLTATISSSVASGRAVFYDGPLLLGSATVSGGVATLATYELNAGTRVLKAKYLGDAMDSASTSAPVSVKVQAVSSGYFSFLSDVNVGLTPLDVVAADFNGDGFHDLAIANAGDSSISILLGGGTGGFTTTSQPNSGTSPYALVPGDFNNDGKIDLAVVNSGDNAVSILLGNGDGSFQAPRAYAVGSGPVSIAAADFNGDGNLDVAVCNFSDGTVSILLGNGDGSLRSQATAGVGSGPQSIAIGDFNTDGNADLVIANSNDNTVSILPGQGDGTFAAPITFTTGPGPMSVAVGDFNADGNPDIATANYGDFVTEAGGGVSVFLGVGDGTFRTPIYSIAGSLPAGLAIGDINGDGFPDLIVVNSTGVSLLLGVGDGSFQSPQSYLPNVSPSGALWGEFNGDGRPDIAVTDAAGNDLALLLGTGPVTVPNVIGTTLALATNAIGTAGLAVGVITWQQSNTVPQGNVISQNPAPDTILTTGSTVSLVISAGNGMLNSQTINFSPLSNVSLGTPPFTIAATASSGLPTSFVSGTPAVCTVSGNTVTIVGIGTCSITASQPGNETYLPAPSGTQSLTVIQATQMIAGSGTYDDQGGFVGYSGLWQQNSLPTLFDGTQSFTNQAGASASILFAGSQVSYVYVTNSNRGFAQISIDGAVVTPQLDEYSTTRQSGQIVTYAGLSSGNHSLTITALGQHAAAAVDSYIGLDALIVGPIPTAGTYDDQSSSVGYTGSWQQNSPPTVFNATQSFSNQPGVTASLLFSGTQVSYMYVANANRGFAQISIDGTTVSSQLDEYSATLQTGRIVTYTGLSNGTHLIAVTALGQHDGSAIDSYIDLDALIVGPIPSAGTYDDQGGSVGYTGLWQQNSLSAVFNGTQSFSNRAGSSANFYFTGTQVSYLYVTNSNRGFAQISIDGTAVNPQLDEYSATLQTGRTVTYGGLSNGTHLLTVTVLGQHNPAAIDSYVDLDALNVGAIPAAGTYDDQSGFVGYTGSWQQNSSPIFFNATQSYSNQAGSTASFLFTGTQVSYVYVTNSNRGFAQVSIDGAAVTPMLDEYSAALESGQIVTYSGLSNGTHILTVTAQGQHDAVATASFIDLDALIVGPTQ